MGTTDVEKRALKGSVSIGEGLAVPGLEPIAAPIPTACRVSGLSRSELYRRLAAGDDSCTVKSGSHRPRSLWTACGRISQNLPAATFRAPKSHDRELGFPRFELVALLILATPTISCPIQTAGVLVGRGEEGGSKCQQFLFAMMRCVRPSPPRTRSMKQRTFATRRLRSPCMPDRRMTPLSNARCMKSVSEPNGEPANCCVKCQRRLAPVSQSTEAEGATRSNDTTASPAQTLTEVGITKDQSSQWQKLAAVPEAEFEEQLANPVALPTAAHIIAAHEAKTFPQPVPGPQVDDAALWLWGRLKDFQRMGLLDRDPNEVCETMILHMKGTTRELAPVVATWLGRITG